MEKEELLQRINKSVPLMAELAKVENVIADYPKTKSKAYKWILALQRISTLMFFKSRRYVLLARLMISFPMNFYKQKTSLSVPRQRGLISKYLVEQSVEQLRKIFSKIP